MKRRIIVITAYTAIAVLWFGFFVSHVVLLDGVNSIMIKEANRLEAASKPGGKINFTLAVANLDDASSVLGLAKDIQVLAGVFVSLLIAVLVYCALSGQAKKGQAEVSQAERAKPGQAERG